MVVQRDLETLRNALLYVLSVYAHPGSDPAAAVRLAGPLPHGQASLDVLHPGREYKKLI